MTEVPEDVMEKAREAFASIEAMYDDMGLADDACVDIVAYAILAERERCAMIAETWHPDDVRPQDLYRWSMTANEIAASIRSNHG